MVVINFTDADAAVDRSALFRSESPTEPQLVVAVSSDGVGEGRTFDGSLRPDQAVVLTRSR